MRLKYKRVLGVLLTTILTVTSINVSGIQSKAGTESFVNEMVDLSGVETNVNIANGGDSKLISSLTADTYTIEQEVYNNYCTYEGLSATASTQLQSANYAIDGNTNSRWESEHGVDTQYLQIDFGNRYLLKNIAIYWEGASAKDYRVEVSADGTTFTTLTEVSSNYGKRTDEITLSKEISVRAVRIYCTSRVTQYGDSIYEIAFYGSEEQKEYVSVLSNLKVKDYYKYTGKYLIYFTEPEESSGYNIYLDESTTPLKKINGSGAHISADELKGVSEGEHTLSVVNLDESGNESAKAATTFTITGDAGTNTEIAQIYINTNGAISTEYFDDDDVTISVVDKDGGSYEELYDSECNIKVRGNTTSTAPKKPWNIKLSGKNSILGMDKGKKWCLLANSFDKSLMRNSLAYDFGLEIGVTYTSQSRYVDVYLNGTFQGSYLITEPVEAKKERVDNDAYDADSNDILLELGTRYEADVDHFTTTTLGTTFDVNDPEKGDDLTDDEVYAKIDRVNAYLSEFESVLLAQNYDEILEYIDEDTFVNFYIVNEFFKNVDFNFSSTRFYIKDEKIYAGPLWDFDLSSGNCKSSYYTAYYVDGVSYKGYYCQDMNWYKQLLKNENFYNKVKERYKELQYIIQNIYSENSETQISVGYLLNTYENSFQRNYMSADVLGAGWSLTNEDGYSYSAESGWTTWQQPIEFLRSWLENRNIWLCGQWGIDMETAYEESKPGDEEPDIPETTVPETTTEEMTTEEMTSEESTAEEITSGEITSEESTAEEATSEEVTSEGSTTEEATSEEVTSEESTTEEATSEEVTSEESTAEEITTEEASTITESQTTQADVTNSATDKNTTDKNYQSETTKSSDVKVAKVKIKKVAKKKKAKKVKISIKKVKKAAKYQVQISKSKKFNKKNILVRKTVKKATFTITNKKLKKKKKLYIRVRAVKVVEGTKYYGKWSKKTKCNITK